LFARRRGWFDDPPVGDAIPAEVLMLIDVAEPPTDGVSPVLVEAVGIGRRDPDGMRWLLHDVSLAVRAGERIGLVGATGSGKTLLLRSFALLDRIDTGHILWKGSSLPPDAIPAFRRRVAFLHQRPVLFPGTVEDNLRAPFALRTCRSLRFDRRATVGQLDAIGRGESFLTQRQGNLSGGEQQIVALLRALQLDPVMLLLDEPTAALDAHTAHCVEALIATWQRAKPHARATLWVTHDRDQAQRIADRIVTMRGGTLTAGA